MREQVGQRVIMKKVRKQAPQWAGFKLPQIPNFEFLQAFVAMSHQEEPAFASTKHMRLFLSWAKNFKKATQPCLFRLLGYSASCRLGTVTGPGGVSEPYKRR